MCYLGTSLPLIYRLIQSQDNEIQVLENNALRDLVSILMDKFDDDNKQGRQRNKSGSPAKSLVLLPEQHGDSI